MTRLAVVTTHPIQHYAPWFRHLANQSGLDVRVFYLWDFGVTRQRDPGFHQEVCWDVPLLDGYSWEFVPNRSRRPGTSHFWGIDNPELLPRLRQFDPAGVLCLGYNYASFAQLLTFWDRRRAPLLLRGDSHRLVPPRGWRAALKRLAVAAVFRRFAACLYVGQANRAYLRLHGVPDRQLFFSPHAVDNARFTAEADHTRQQADRWRLELGIRPTDRVVLFAGKFEDKKRPLDLLAAFTAAKLDQVALLLVGAGPLESSLRQAAHGQPQVVLAPFQNQSLMPRTYAAADVLVLPSYGPSETWGLCVNEAMCLGRPAIVSSHVGCGLDLVEPGQTGLIFPAGNVAALTECLRMAFQDPERLGNWGSAARARVADYSYERATQGVSAALSALNAGISR